MSLIRRIRRDAAVHVLMALPAVVVLVGLVFGLAGDALGVTGNFVAQLDTELQEWWTSRAP